MLEWIILDRCNVADLMHYLDEFLTAGPAGSDQCAQNLQTALAVCHLHVSGGVQLGHDKKKERKKKKKNLAVFWFSPLGRVYCP